MHCPRPKTSYLGIYSTFAGIDVYLAEDLLQNEQKSRSLIDSSLFFANLGSETIFSFAMDNPRILNAMYG